MKVKVIHEFRDRTANLVLRKTDEVLEVDGMRAVTLESHGLVERIREPAKKEPKETAAKWGTLRKEGAPSGSCI